jgi:DNA (cytosine-5)-methyltransferase 3A
MKVLSLFDGMSCGMLAMQSAGIEVGRYVAFEIDKYAVQTSSHNFPMIEHRGDVFQADFTEFRGFDFLVGGSPCTYWSIAQKNNRETEASGMGWELFSQYVRALHEAQPMYFIYENNKSMSNAIRESITETFGFEPICINSALVSAQNRQRLYWVGKRNTDGTYSRVKVEQPEDRGILLRDVLDGSYAKELSEREVGYMVRSTNGKYNNRWSYLQKPGESDKSLCITANVSKGVPYNVCAVPVNTTPTAKSQTIKAQYQQTSPRNICCYTSTFGASGVAEPVRVGAMPRPNGELSTSQGFRVYSTDGKAVNIKACAGGAGGKTGLYAIQCCPMSVREATKQGFTEIQPGECADLTQPNSKTRRGRNMAEKSNCLMTSCQYWQYCGVLGYATPCEWDEDGRPIKATSAADGKVYTVYEVKDGLITLKGKQYPIKLLDGNYIIRKLTVTECKRLQTVPEQYEFPVSDAQAYKMLGNGWTVEVIVHLIKATQTDELEDDQLDLFRLGGN